jgi:DNA polymerase-3 subunit gamma/tau
MKAVPEALRIVARKADGGMRDALSLLDQVLSLTGGEVDIDSVRRVLGLVEEERYLELLDVLREARHADVFVLVEGLVDEGYDLVEFHHGLLDVLRLLLRLRLQPDAALDVREDFRVALAERAADFEPGDLVRMLAAAADLESQGSLRRNPNPRLPIEMLLLRMSFLDHTVSLEELIRAMGGASAPDGGGGPGGTARPARGARSRPAPGRAREAAAEPRLAAAAPPPPATDRPAVSGPAASRSAGEAWQAWLAEGKVPAGLSAFLRAAEVSELEDGALQIRGLVPPAAERLADRVIMEAVREAFSPYLGRPARLVLEAGPEVTAAPSSTRRVTEEEVRTDTLKALYRQEPRLERAVQALDLELMD